MYNDDGQKAETCSEHLTCPPIQKIVLTETNTIEIYEYSCIRWFWNL
jgi:hypothetical protein